MPPPSNISFATATNLSLPADVTQNVHDAGTTYEVFYKFTAPVDAKVVGVFAFGDLSVYMPTIIPYNASQVQILSIVSPNKPFFFPVTEGQVHYIKITPNGGNPIPASLRVQAEVGPTLAIETGNLLINDDTPGFPVSILSHLVDHQVRRFVNNMPSGEAGDILPTSGIFCLSDEYVDYAFKIYNPDFSLIASLPYSPTTLLPRVRTCNATEKFWVTFHGFGGGQVKTISAAGALGSTVWTLADTNIGSIAVNNDETILYHARNSIGAAVSRYDLIGSVALSDLAAIVTGYRVCDILYLSDNTIIVIYFAFAGTRDIFVRRYSTAGAVLNTYNFGTANQSFLPRLAYAIDSPNSFWVWIHKNTEISHFINVKCSDGSVLATRIFVEYELGVYEPDPTGSPLARFGSSESCPFMQLRVGGSGEPEPPVEDLSGIYAINPDGTHDVYNGSIAKKIPNPTIDTALFGE